MRQIEKGQLNAYISSMTEARLDECIAERFSMISFAISTDDTISIGLWKTLMNMISPNQCCSGLVKEDMVWQVDEPSDTAHR